MTPLIAIAAFILCGILLILTLLILEMVAYKKSPSRQDIVWMIAQVFTWPLTALAVINEIDLSAPFNWQYKILKPLILKL